MWHSRRLVGLVRLACNCSLFYNLLAHHVFDAVANAIRTSSVQNLSLRLNKIGPAGAVSIATMMKDYPDSLPAPSGSSSPTPFSLPLAGPVPRSFSIPSRDLSTSPQLPPTSLPESTSVDPSPAPSTPTRLTINRFFGNATSTPRQRTPPPQTTYTPYVPRSKRNLASTRAQAPIDALNLSEPAPASLQSSASSSPLITTSPPLLRNHLPSFSSSKSGGVTSRHYSASSCLVNGNNDSSTTGLKISTPGGITGTSKNTALDGHSLALLDKVRSFDNLPRLGALTTLNLRGNECPSSAVFFDVPVIPPCVDILDRKSTR